MRVFNLVTAKVILIALFGILMTGSVALADTEGVLSVDPNLPASWFGERPLASELGITSFSESPMLAERVAAGLLPPVEERLPKDPPTIEPYERIGKYGGVAHVWARDLDMGVGDGRMLAGLSGNYLMGRATPDAQRVLPNLVQGWEYSEDATQLTIQLREGLKWSDGHPFTADDFVFWWEHVALNEELNPIPPHLWQPGILNVEKNNDYSVTFTFNAPSPLVHNTFHKQSGWVTNYPAHYMKQFHPAFRDLDELLAEAKQAGFDTWHQYFDYMTNKNYPERKRPVLDPYVVKERGLTYIEFERNPYYPFVDTEGNQLPYLDGVRINLVADRAMKRIKAFEGNAAIAGPHLFSSDIPLYIDGEEQGNYTTYIWSSGMGSESAIMLNLTHQDPEIREVFNDVRFRRALSHAIDRNEINDRLFFGMATPRQSTVIDSSQYFKPEYATASIEYNPELSKRLLDEMGVVDRNGDGIRELPSGRRFNLTMLFVDSAATPIIELVLEFFRDIGIDVRLDMVSRELLVERRIANNFDLSQWHIDYVTDIYFGATPTKTFAPIGTGQEYSPWPAWIAWANSGGTTGEEPPAHIKQLIEWLQGYNQSIDPAKRAEYAEKLLQAQADNLWTIGTVGQAPVPVIVANNFHNVPRHGMLNDDVDWGSVYFPEQFYLDPIP